MLRRRQNNQPMRQSAELVASLAGGDRRSVGRANQVANATLRDPRRFPALMAALAHRDRLVRMRAVDAMEKITLRRPELLQPYRARLLRAALAAEDKELRWHLALMLPRLRLTPAQRALASDVMFEWLRDESRIVQTFALQALADFSAHDEQLRLRVLTLAAEMAERGAPAVRARARKLLRQLQPARRARGQHAGI